jgi:predicted transcriptional regulator YdeE
MSPIIQKMPQKILAGFSFFGDPFHSHAGWTEANEIGRLWQRLMTFLALPENQSIKPTQSYEVLLQSHSTPQTGKFEVFVGYEVTDLKQIPVELCLKILPESLYAVFTISGQQMHADHTIVDNWMTANGYQQAFPFFAQRYDERFKGVDQLDDSVWDILTPIIRANSDDRA